MCLSFIMSSIFPFSISTCREHLPCARYQDEAAMSGSSLLVSRPSTQSDQYFLVTTVCQAPCRGGQASHCPSQECGGNRHEPHDKCGLNEDAYGGVGG